MQPTSHVTAQTLTLSRFMNLVVDFFQNSLLYGSANPKASADKGQANTETNAYSCVTSGIRFHDTGVRAAKFRKRLRRHDHLSGSKYY